jgi:signal transduction histidine kinase
LSHIGDYGPARERASFAPPLLMECDRQGQVLWLSAAARSVLGDAGNLADTIRPDWIVCLSVVLKTRESVLISVQMASLAQIPTGETRELSDLRDSMVRNFIRLQEVERGLSTRARQIRPGAGRRAILQIDLERQRLGRELHTGVAQMLIAIRTQLEIVSAQTPSPPEPVEAALGRISILLTQTLEQVRSVSRELHPPEWQRLTLANALQQMWDLSGIPQRYEASLRIPPLPHEPELEVKVLLYRAAQEALSNLIQHSRATRIDLSLEASGSLLVLRIEDNGVGFDVAKQLAAPADVGMGIGLRSIRDQAESLGGKMSVESGPGGTRLEVSAPFGT